MRARRTTARPASPAPHDAAFYRSRSFWLDNLDDDPLTPRDPLDGDVEADVAIVGAGFTGLWTAHYLLQRDPGMRIVLLEAEIAGFGASGRNGGWAAALLPMRLDAIARDAGGERQAAIDLQDEMHRSVDELARAAAELGVQFDYAKGGSLHLATNPAQLPRLHSELASWREWGYGEEHHRLLTHD